MHSRSGHIQIKLHNKVKYYVLQYKILTGNNVKRGKRS